MADSPAPEPSKKPRSDRRQINFRLVAIYCVYFLVAAEGASQVFSFDNRSIYVIFSIGFAIFASIWALHDSRVRNINFYYPLRMLYLFTCPLSALVYLIYTRGWWGLGLAFLNFIAIVVVSNIAFFGTYYLIYFSGFWDLYDPIFFEAY